MDTSTAQRGGGSASAAHSPAIADAIARHVVDLRFESLSAGALAAAKRLMLDTLVVAWAGSDAPGSSDVKALLDEQGGRAESSIWGYGGRLPAPAATFLNGMFAAALDYDGINTVHADIVTLPAALALAERGHASGRSFITAFVIGSDLCCRLGAATVPPHKGWFNSSIFGVFGAAATGARLLGLDASATRHALGIALSQAAGTQQANVEQALTKRMQSAFAAQAGVFSVLLAARGVTAPRETFDGKFGLYQLYQPGNPETILDGLGRRLLHENTTIKKYPSCACNHAAIEATLQIVNEHDIKPEDVISVETTLSPLMHRLVGAPFDPSENPQVTAQFSVQYSVACAILRRRLVIADIQDDAVLDPAIRALTQRIRVIVDETNKGSRVPAEVAIATRQHGTIRRRVEKFPWGHEDLPPDEALNEKFRDCMRYGAKPLTPSQMDLLVGRVREIENIPDMAEFFSSIL